MAVADVPRNAVHQVVRVRVVPAAWIAEWKRGRDCGPSSSDYPVIIPTNIAEISPSKSDKIETTVFSNLRKNIVTTPSNIELQY